MAVLYKMYQNNRSNFKNKGMWYARAIHPNTIHTEQIAELIQRNCTVKKSDVVAVLTELIEVMHDELQASHNVKLDGFGTFRIGFKSLPVEKPYDFNPVSDIIDWRVNFAPESTGGGKGIKRQRRFLEKVKAQQAPVNKVDMKKPKDADDSGSQPQP